MLAKLWKYVKWPGGAVTDFFYSRPRDVTSWFTHFFIVHLVTLVAVGLLPRPWGGLTAIGVVGVYLAREALMESDDMVDLAADLIFVFYGFISAAVMLA